MNAVETFGLEVIAEDIKIDGTDWAVYSDGEFSWVVPQSALAAPAHPAGYDAWCALHVAVEHKGLCARIAAAVGLRGVHAGKTGTWCPAADHHVWSPPGGVDGIDVEVTVTIRHDGVIVYGGPACLRRYEPVSEGMAMETFEAEPPGWPFWVSREAANIGRHLREGSLADWLRAERA